MNITLNIEAASPAELQEAITGLAGIVGDNVQQPSTTTNADKQKQSRKQADKDPDPEKQQEPEKEPEKQVGPESVKSEMNITEDLVEIPTVVDLRAKAQEKGKTAEGKKAIKALLDEFGSKSISDVPEKERAAFLARLEEL